MDSPVTPATLRLHRILCGRPVERAHIDRAVLEIDLLGSHLFVQRIQYVAITFGQRLTMKQDGSVWILSPPFEREAINGNIARPDQTATNQRDA